MNAIHCWSHSYFGVCSLHRSLSFTKNKDATSDILYFFLHVCHSACIVTASVSGLHLFLSLFMCLHTRGAAMLYIPCSITQSCTHLSDVQHCLFTLPSAVLPCRRIAASGPMSDIHVYLFSPSVCLCLQLCWYLSSSLLFLSPWLFCLPVFPSLWCWGGSGRMVAI